MRFLVRRLLHAVFVLAAVSVLAFALMQVAPGEFVSELQLNPQVSAETVAAIRTQYGLDRPLMQRYASWANALAHGDLGYSLAYHMPVRSLLMSRVANTLLLTITAALLAWIISIPLGIYAAVREGGWLDRFVGGATSLMLAIPEITLALALLLIALHTHWLPVGGMSSARNVGTQSLADLLSHMALPVIVIVIATLPTLTRHVRASMLDVLGSAHIRAARAHGLPEPTVLSYALRAAANPLISFAGFSVASLLSGSLVVEVIASWPGMGPLVVESVLDRDVHVVVGAVLLSAICLLIGNLLADLLLYAADPRIRLERA